MTTVMEKARQSGQGFARADRKPKKKPGVGVIVPSLAHTPTFTFVAVHADKRIRTLKNVTGCTWDDSNAILTGTLQVTALQFNQPDGPGIEEGDRILCSCDMGGGPKLLWTMRVQDVNLESANDGTWTFDLVNDLQLLAESDDLFLYQKDKRHPHGWLGHEIIKDVCLRYRVPIGGLYKGTKPVTVPHKYGHPDPKSPMIYAGRMSPLEVIRQVIVWERRKSGRRLMVRWDHNELYVIPVTQNPQLLALGPTLIDMQMRAQVPPQFASAIQIHGLATRAQTPQDPIDTGAGHAGQLPFDVTNQKGKPWLDMTSPASIARYGYVHKILFSPDARNFAQLREEGQRFLAGVAKPIKSITVEHQVLPYIRRGDAITLGFGPQMVQQMLCWVGSVQHQLSADGQYTTTVTVLFHNPFVPLRNKIWWRLKSTQDEAIGGRLDRNPGFYADRKNHKGDKYSAAQSKAARVFWDAQLP